VVPNRNNVLYLESLVDKVRWSLFDSFENGAARVSQLAPNKVRIDYCDFARVVKEIKNAAMILHG
jgi:hypothetical protein